MVTSDWRRRRSNVQRPFLSRRDKMIAAWQFTARFGFNKRKRPVGNGVIGAEGTFYHLEG
jgi:hypothetical protein